MLNLIVYGGKMTQQNFDDWTQYLNCSSQELQKIYKAQLEAKNLENPKNNVIFQAKLIATYLTNEEKNQSPTQNWEILRKIKAISGI